MKKLFLIVTISVGLSVLAANSWSKSETKKSSRSPSTSCISREQAVRKAAGILEGEAQRGRSVALDIAGNIVFDENGQQYLRKAGRNDENLNDYVVVQCSGHAYLVVDRR